MKRAEFAEVAGFLSSAVGREMAREQAESWFLMVRDLTVEQFRHGVRLALQQHTFAGFPPIALILQLSGAVSGSFDLDRDADLAWGKVLKAIRRFGAYHSVAWDDPAIVAALLTIGESWPWLCDRESDELHRFVRPKFIDAFKAHRAAGTAGSTLTPGILARDAGRLGFNGPKPIRVGQDAPQVTGFGEQALQKIEQARGDSDVNAESLGDALKRLIDSNRREPKP